MGRRITIVVEGSRGDWQPSVAGGAALSREGFEVQLLGPPDVKEQAERHGMTFVETWPMSSKEYATTPENVEAFTQNSFLKMITAATAVRKSVNEVVITRIYEALTAYKPELVLSASCPVLFVESAAHAKLFPKCKVMVHHGGSGTTSACAMSGVPAVVTPVFFDQFGNAELVNKQGNGVGMMKGLNSITAEELADALKTAQSPAIRQKAQEVAAEMAKENGAAQMVVEVKRFLQDVVDTGIYKSDKAAWEKRRLEAERKNWWPCCCS
ncbi:unnamed protein product [Effrenium voratum]|nr:unnamed protein product [Effrenium voratum]